MNARRLLERIGAPARETDRRDSEMKRACLDSVLSHLQKILNTRQGSVPIADDYGIPDFLDLLQSYPESVHVIEQSIRKAIEKYEPRLSGPTVTLMPDEENRLILRFQIVAELTLEGRPTMSFQTVIGTNGRVVVRR